MYMRGEPFLFVLQQITTTAPPKLGGREGKKLQYLGVDCSVSKAAIRMMNFA